jgi:hypothetical protein
LEERITMSKIMTCTVIALLMASLTACSGGKWGLAENEGQGYYGYKVSAKNLKPSKAAPETVVPKDAGKLVNPNEYREKGENVPPVKEEVEKKK